jgi:hypothetical protein
MRLADGTQHAASSPGPDPAGGGEIRSMYDAVLEVAHTLWKNGLSLSALGTAVYVLLKQRRVKRVLRRLLPWILSDESEVKAYIANQQIIMENQRRIMAALGVKPACPNAVTSETSTSFPVGRRTFSTLSWAARSRVRAAAGRETSSITSSTIMRRMIPMKKWIKPDTIAIIGGILAAALARMLGVEIEPTNFVAAVVVLAGYFKAHEFITIVRDANGLPVSFRVNSRKFIFTSVAFALIVADIVLELNLGNELIFAITAAVTGYNFVEARKDAAEAEHEADEARQIH